jgi:hypothetical protein
MADSRPVTRSIHQQDNQAEAHKQSLVMKDIALPMIGIVHRGMRLAMDILAWEVARHATWRSLRTYPDQTLTNGAYCRLVKRT